MIRVRPAWRKKKLLVFDLDGTLTESKAKMDPELSFLLVRLLERKPVAVIGGGKYQLFKKNFLKALTAPRRLLANLFLFPTTSTSFYRYRGGWKLVYAHKLTAAERRKIKKAFAAAFREMHYHHPRRLYGPVIEDRGTQITFSALGQRAPLRLKKEWKRRYAPLKMQLVRTAQKHLPGLEVRAAGFTSIDVTRKGIDKAYGIRQIRSHLKVPIRDTLFVGDALFPGGNDYAAKRTGVECVQVSGPRETKKLIRFLVAG